jgi:hypothetical protein
MTRKPRTAGASAVVRRRVVVLCGLASLGTLTMIAGLAVAQVVQSNSFLLGLVLSGFGIGLACAALVALGVGAERIFLPGVEGWLAFGLGGAAALGRMVLILNRPQVGNGPPPVIMVREIFFGVPLALALCSLLLGAHVVYRTVSLPPGGLREPGRRSDLLAGGLALSGALYTLGPLLQSFGVPLNHWTFIGLAALGALGFLVASLIEKVIGA